jgi:SHS2 domain-containing protein
MGYKFLEDVALADVAFEAEGKTLKELFNYSGLAITNTMVKNIESIEHKVKKEISVSSDDIEMLLFNFLQEIIFYKDAEQLIFSKFELDIFPEGKKWKLNCNAYGEKIDTSKHEMLVDVKAVSLHQFKVEETEDGWRATVILDV